MLLCASVPLHTPHPRLLGKEAAPPHRVKGNRHGGHGLVPSRIAPQERTTELLRRAGGPGWAGTEEPSSGKRTALVKATIRASSGKDAEEGVKNHKSYLRGRATVAPEPAFGRWASGPKRATG